MQYSRYCVFSNFKMKELLPSSSLSVEQYKYSFFIVLGNATLYMLEVPGFFWCSMTVVLYQSFVAYEIWSLSHTALYGRIWFLLSLFGNLVRFELKKLKKCSIHSLLHYYWSTFRRYAGIPDFLTAEDMDAMVRDNRVDPKMIFSYVQEVYRMCNEM